MKKTVRENLNNSSRNLQTTIKVFFFLLFFYVYVTHKNFQVFLYRELYLLSNNIRNYNNFLGDKKLGWIFIYRRAGDFLELRLIEKYFLWDIFMAELFIYYWSNLLILFFIFPLYIENLMVDVLEYFFLSSGLLNLFIRGIS